MASMSRADRDKITEVLGVEPILINSALVSAQQRKRLYWTNIPGVTQPTDRGILLKDILDSGMPYLEKSQTLMANYGSAVFWNSLQKKQRTMVAEPVRLGGFYGQITRWGIYDKYGKSPTLTASMGMGGGFVSMIPEKLGYICGKDYQQNRVYSVRGKSVSLNGNGGGWEANTGLYKIDLPDGDYTIRKLTPVECERLQTWPDGYTEGVSNTQRYKMIGNGWTADVVAHIFGFIPKEEAREANH